MPGRLEEFVKIIYEHFRMDVAGIIPISMAKKLGVKRS
jgi:hypothetical protein